MFGAVDREDTFFTGNAAVANVGTYDAGSANNTNANSNSAIGIIDTSARVGLFVVVLLSVVLAC
jgi:hypothetical protein